MYHRLQFSPILKCHRLQFLHRLKCLFLIFTQIEMSSLCISSLESAQLMIQPESADQYLMLADAYLSRYKGMNIYLFYLNYLKVWFNQSALCYFRQF